MATGGVEQAQAISKPCWKPGRQGPAQSGSQLFVETHSDHIINGIRVAVKEKLIEKEKVNILFFDKETAEKEQYAKITPILVDGNGSLSDYPDNFMDEWSSQLSKLI